MIQSGSDKEKLVAKYIQRIHDTKVEKFTSFFLFPFVYDRGPKIEPGSNWKIQEFRIPLKPGEIETWKQQRNYAEYIYFHDYVRKFLYPQKLPSGAFPQDSVVFYEYQEKGPLKVEITYKVAKDTLGLEYDQRTLAASIDGIYLYLFPHSVGILSIEIGNNCENIARPDPADTSTRDETIRVSNGADILRFHELFRRIYPSYFEKNDKDRTDGFLKQVNKAEFPWKVLIRQSDKEVYRYEAEKILDNVYLQPGQTGRYIPAMSSYVANLMNGVFGIDPSKQSEPSQKVPYTPILDDRMLVYTYVEFSKKMAPQSDEKTEQEMKEAANLYFAQLLYVDAPAKEYRYESGFMETLMAEHTYRRWDQYSTKIGFSRYSGAFLYFGHDENFYRTFESMYYQMFLLIVYYRACLIRFSDEIAEVAKHFPETDKVKQPAAAKFVNELRTLRTHFMKFMNIHWFKEVSHQDQGIELFSIMRKAFDLDDMYGQVKEEIERADDLSELFRQGQIERLGRKMTIWGIVIAMVALIATVI